MRYITQSAAILGAVTAGVIAGASPVLALQSIDDGEFLSRAVGVSKQEVSDAGEAASASSHSDVRQTALAIKNDHLRASQRLADLARLKGLNMLQGEMSLVKPDATDLTKDSDAERIAGLLKAHEEAVALFHQEAVRGVDPELKSFAQTTLPTLQRRLQTLRSLQNSYPETT